MKDTTIYVRISEDLKEKLKKYCDQHKLTMSEAIRMFIEKEVDPVDPDIAIKYLSKKLEERDEEAIDFIQGLFNDKKL